MAGVELAHGVDHEECPGDGEVGGVQDAALHAAARGRQVDKRARNIHPLVVGGRAVDDVDLYGLLQDGNE